MPHTRSVRRRSSSSERPSPQQGLEALGNRCDERFEAQRTQNEAVDGRFAALENQLQTFEGDAQQQTRQVTDLLIASSRQCDALQTENEQNKAERERWKSTSEQSKAKCDAVESELEKAKWELEEAKSELEEAKSEVGVLESERDALKSENE